MKTLPLFLALALLGFAPAPAAPLATGNYHFAVPVGPVLLNGRYPVFVNENTTGLTAAEGRLNVVTSPTGKITGTVDIYAEHAAVTGSVKIRKSGVTLKLKGQDRKREARLGQDDARGHRLQRHGEARQGQRPRAYRHRGRRAGAA